MTKEQDTTGSHSVDVQPPPGHEITMFGRGLTFWILSSLVAGLVAGVVLHQFAGNAFVDDVLVDGFLKVGGQIFLSLLKLLVVPVVFVSLVCGVGALDDIKRMGRIGGKTIALYLLTTALAISLALITALLTSPGAGFNLETQAEFSAKEAPGLAETIVGIFPSNPVQAMAEANMLQVIVLALLVGLSMSLAGKEGKRALAVFNDFNAVVMKLVTLVMLVAPIGVFCLLAAVFARQGFEAIAPLSKYFLTVLGVLVLHGFFVYAPLLRYLGGLSPVTFVRKFQEVIVFAFSTSSSNASLPVTLGVVEHQLGVKNSVASFTLPLGATVNMDGTAIMQGVATVFISQAYGVEIGLLGYLTVIATATVASIGTAGVPGVGMITLAMVLNQVGLPVEGIGLILGVDRLLDMARTSLNVSGDAVVTCIVARSEGQLDERVYSSGV